MDGFLAQGLRIERRTKNNEAPLRNSEPVVRPGRKATDQVNFTLRAGLPKRGIGDLQGVGSQAEELNPMPGILFFGNQPETHVITTFRFALSLLSWLVFVACFVPPAEAAGPLSVGSSNPRLFVDSNGKPVYLTGVQSEQ